MNMLPHTPPPHDSPHTAGNVDQIRDILFGGQMREYDHRFTQVEDRIVAEHEKLRQETQDQARGVHEALGAALRDLAARVETDKSEHSNTAQGFAKETRAALENLAREVREAAERNEQRHRELAGQLKALEETARHERDTLAIRLDQQLKQLAATSADRTSVADLFAEMSARFRGNAGGPAA